MASDLSTKESEENFGLFCAKCPLLTSKLVLTKMIPFETGCGSDRRCQADFDLQLKTDIKSVVQGYHDMLILTVIVTNKGENAFATKLTLSIVPYLEINQVEAGWNIEELYTEVKFASEVDNPLEKQTTKEIKIPFSLSKINYQANQIDFRAEVKTTSDLKANSKSTANLTIQIERYASLALIKYVGV